MLAILHMVVEGEAACTVWSARNGVRPGAG